jgi:hypothetical protein
VPQPEYVPVRATDEVRPVERLPAPRRWKPDRPADFRPGPRSEGRGLGTPGPDQGYGLLLARRFAGRLELTPGESEHDAMAGGVAVALKRAAVFGRAPVLADLELAFTLFGFLGDGPADLVEGRREIFAGAGHAYSQTRWIADRVPEATLRLTPARVRDRLGSWRELMTEG